MTPEGSVFPYRDLTLFLAFAAILFTLVGQGLTLAPIVRAFGQGRGHHGGDGRAARVRAAEAALEALARMEQSGAADAALIQPVRAEYQARLAGLAQADGHAEPAPPGADLAGVRKAAINAERRALLTLAKDHALDEHLLNELLDALDLAEVAASRGGAG
jgi:CPA1 family monovalent cation:H+ antiporter